MLIRKVHISHMFLPNTQMLQIQSITSCRSHWNICPEKYFTTTPMSTSFCVQFHLLRLFCFACHSYLLHLHKNDHTVLLSGLEVRYVCLSLFPSFFPNAYYCTLLLFQRQPDFNNPLILLIYSQNENSIYGLSKHTSLEEKDVKLKLNSIQFIEDSTEW